VKTSLHLTPSVRMLGARQSLAALVTHLDPDRYRPIVVVPFASGELVDHLTERSIRCHRVRMGQWRKVKFWPRIPLDLFELRRFARRELVGLVHCNEPHVVPYGLRVARDRGRPCVAHVRLDNVDAKLVRVYGLDKADMLIAVSEAVAAQLTELTPERADRVRVIPNGVDADHLRQTALARAEARRRLGITDADLLIAQVGLISPRKRCHVVIEAFAKIAWTFPRAKLFFVGSPGPSDQAYGKAVDQDIERRGLLDRVRLLPFRRDIGSLYAALDVNVLASSQEGFGRVLIEAAVFGVPSIGTRVGGIPEIIGDGETGLLVPPDDAAALAKAMEALLSSEAYRSQLGEAAGVDMEARFSVAAHARAVMDLFDEVSGGR
jgi:glycosyltransferase involved in cell wall biosynthesis